MKTSTHSNRPNGAERSLRGGARKALTGLLTAAALLLAACDKDNHDPDPEAVPFLTISPAKTDISFGAAGEESYTFKVSTNQPIWLPVSDQEWCKVAIDIEKNTLIVTAIPNNETTPPPPATITVTAGKAAPLTIRATQDAARYDIYLAGIYTSQTGDQICYWKNGVRTALSQVADNLRCSAMTVSDGSLYVAGSIGTEPGYWKDGERVVLDNERFYSTGSIAVENESVYVMGPGGSGYYWKNNEIMNIESPQFTGIAIAVTNGSVYVAGQVYLSIGGGLNMAYIWNYRATPLALPVSDAGYSDALCITASDGSVYIGGYFDTAEGISIPCYWKGKDGVGIPLELPQSYHGNPTAIAVENGTVYTAGVIFNDNHEKLCYWVDKKCIELELPDGVTYCETKGITAVDGRVYVAGIYYKDNRICSCYWVDGKRTDLKKDNELDDIDVVGIGVMKL